LETAGVQSGDKVDKVAVLWDVTPCSLFCRTERGGEGWWRQVVRGGKEKTEADNFGIRARSKQTELCDDVQVYYFI